MIHVLTVGTRVREAFETFLALERLLSAVQALVFRQVVFMLERFRAHVTLVRTLTCNTRSNK
jgi:hypothetical protein